MQINANTLAAAMTLLKETESAQNHAQSSKEFVQKLAEQNSAVASHLASDALSKAQNKATTSDTSTAEKIEQNKLQNEQMLSGSNTAPKDSGTQKAQGNAQQAMAAIFSNKATISDFALLNKTNPLLAQANLLREGAATMLTTNILQTAMLAQPSLAMQLSMLQRMFSMIEEQNKGKTLLDGRSIPMTQDSDGTTTAQQSTVLTVVFLERCLKLLYPEKILSLSRMFKKGPIGNAEHDEDTDDELAKDYTDLDGEPDYIKRLRHERTDMDYHYSLLSKH